MRRVANILSTLFHPLLMVTYGIVMALSFSYLAIFPMKLKLIMLSGVFLMTAVIPALFIYLMVKEKAGADWELSNRKYRTMPYLIYVGSVMAALFFLFKMMLPFWVLAQLFGAAVVMLIALCINFFWKISAHMIGIGGLLGGFPGFMHRTHIGDSLHSRWQPAVSALLVYIWGSTRLLRYIVDLD